MRELLFLTNGFRLSIERNLLTLSQVFWSERKLDWVAGLPLWVFRFRFEMKCPACRRIRSATHPAETVWLFVVVVIFVVIVLVIVTFVVVVMFDFAAIRLTVDLDDHPRVRAVFIKVLGQFLVVGNETR